MIRYSDEDIEEREYLPPYLAMLQDDQPDDQPDYPGSPTASGKSVCDSCGHTRRMHSTAGCTWSDPKGNCHCPVTFMDL